MLACDFLTVETVWLARIYVLFFVSLERRRIEFSLALAAGRSLGLAASAESADGSPRPGGLALRETVADARSLLSGRRRGSGDCGDATPSGAAALVPERRGARSVS